MEKFKSWYNALTDATKYMFLLAMIFTITNIVLIIVSGIYSDKIIDISNTTVFSQKNATIYEVFGLNSLFAGLKHGVECAVLIVINIIGYYFSYWIGKFCGFFKSLIEMLTDIKSDGWGYFTILIYDCISVLFDTVTIMSLINIIE